MRSRGKILKLFISASERRGSIEQQKLCLDINGVLNDKFYNKNVERSVLITSNDSYTLVKEHFIDIAYGGLGENMVVDFNPYDLPVGTVINVGETVLEISQHCTLCKSLSRIDSRLPKLLKDNRGVFAKVIKAGIIDQSSKIVY